MGKNTKPMLTVLMEGDKLQQLRDYSAGKSVSMGWLVNRLVDRVLAGELDIMGESISREPIERTISTDVDIESIERIARASIEKHLESVSDYLPLDEIERIAIGAIDKYLEEKIPIVSSIGLDRGSIEELIRVSVDRLQEEIAEVTEFSHNLQGEIAKVKKPLAIV